MALVCSSPLTSTALAGFRISGSSWVFQAWICYSRSRGASHLPSRGEQWFPQSCCSVWAGAVVLGPCARAPCCLQFHWDPKLLCLKLFLQFQNPLSAPSQHTCISLKSALRGAGQLFEKGCWKKIFPIIGAKYSLSMGCHWWWSSKTRVCTMTLFLPCSACGFQLWCYGLCQETVQALRQWFYFQVSD